MVHAVCGNVLASVTITDFGNGTCLAQARDPSRTPPLVDTGDCTGTLFHGATCGAFHGTINLRASNPQNLLVDEYRPPAFQQYLTAAGLGNITVAGAASRAASFLPTVRGLRWDILAEGAREEKKKKKKRKMKEDSGLVWAFPSMGQILVGLNTCRTNTCDIHFDYHHYNTPIDMIISSLCHG